MENRYLFRGKRIDNGEWVEGFLMDEDYINMPFNDNEVGGRFDDPVEINESTLCQCTGLKDKNGNLIWENDIVKDNVIYGAVKWDDANARYVIDDREDGYQDYSEWWQEVEVIGNALDNPELLEGAENDRE